MSPRTATWIAVPFGLTAIVLAVLGVVFSALNGNSLFVILDEDAAGAILAVSISIVGMLVASRRPENWMGWIFCAVGFSQGLVTFSAEYADYVFLTRPGVLGGGPVMAWLGTWVWMPGLGLLLTFALLLFPDGRLPSPRWRVVAWVSALDLALIVPIALLLWPLRGPELLSEFEQEHQILDFSFIGVFWLMLVCGLGSLAGLIWRFRRSQGLERQQLKWFTYAGVFTVAGVILSEVLGSLVGLLSLLILPAAAALPVAAGVAILRHRLYAIDLIIRRTLIYGAITFLLAAVYFGGVALLQTVFVRLTGQESPLALVASTLAIAALFTPVRRRVQDAIDRRFYRRKYDAARTVEAFAAAVRDEVDVDQLSERLLATVEETMQPQHVSLWLRVQDSGSQ